MPAERYRLSSQLRAEQTDEGFVLRAREETGRGKRFGMDGEISMTREEADTFAKWVFTQDLND